MEEKGRGHMGREAGAQGERGEGGGASGLTVVYIASYQKVSIPNNPKLNSRN